MWWQINQSGHEFGVIDRGLGKAAESAGENKLELPPPSTVDPVVDSD
mgnify:CR=1 FL=1